MAPRRAPLASLALLAGLAMLATLAVVALVGASGLPTAARPSAEVAAQGTGITVEFLGWSHYRLTSPSGKVVVTNPFITNNADAAVSLDEAIARGADIILVADGHPDELGDTLALMRATGAPAVVAFEVGVWMTLEEGIPAAQTVRSGPGSVHRFDGITVYTLNAVHGSGIQARSDQARLYGGPALSFMVTFENGFTIYFSGSSAATMDMGLWGDWYKPDAAILHAQDSHDPRSAAMVGKLMTTNNPNLKTVFPHHHRLQPQPGGLFRPADLQAELERMGVNVNFINATPLQPYVLTK